MALIGFMVGVLMCKFLLWLTFTMIAWSGFTFTPPEHFIISQMAKHCLFTLGSLSATITKDGEISFETLEVRPTGIFLPKKSGSRSAVKETAPLRVHFLDDLLKCHPNRDGVESLKKAMINRGININKVSHGLYNYEPVLIMGAEPMDRISPQLWIEKRNFVPIKEINGRTTITFEKWTIFGALSDKRFPRIITVTTNDVSQKIAVIDQ
jgi:hypothetical protein